MADITMCTNKQCPLSESCYRFKAKPNEYRQAYSAFMYRKVYDGMGIQADCDHYIPIAT